MRHTFHKATIKLKTRDGASDLKRAVKKSVDADQKNRIRAIINIKEEAAKTATAKRFVVSRASVISWVAAYNEGGVPALAMSKGGRSEGNPKWDISIFNDMTKEIDKDGHWPIPRMREWLIKNKKKTIPEQTVWRRMNQLDYSCKGAGPHPAQGNKDKQEVFKKGAPLHSWSR